MKILIVGGTFDNNGGRPSSIINKMMKSISEHTNRNYTTIFTINGGDYKLLSRYIQETPDFDIVFWFPNVPNDLEKVRDVKEIAPKVMLVTSKRNDNNKYSFGDIIQRALVSKSNLLFEFSKVEDTFSIRVVDPLGCLWYEGTDIDSAVKKTMDRLEYLKSITRQSTIQSSVDKSLVLSWYFDSFKLDENHSDKIITVPDQQPFVDLVHEYAIQLQKNTPKIKVERFLGNASMKLPPQVGRCGKGMPSFKYNNMVFVSRRNVPKQFIEMSDFVPVWIEDGKLFYSGDEKPSVDTPVQIRLYDALPKIRYIIHTHSYIENIPFTDIAIPCGAVEEAEEVLSLIDRHFGSRNEETYALNLKGHGSIIMADTVNHLKGWTFVERPFPEAMR